LYRRAAEQGVSLAQIKLANKYAQGVGVAADQQAAFFWFKQAALSGHAFAQHNLGVMYTLGQGVEADVVKAYAWTELAAEQGLSSAIQNREDLRKLLSEEQTMNAHRLAERLATKIQDSANEPERPGTLAGHALRPNVAPTAVGSE
jgi:TPR repeat protein